ncbi:MerR family transcriptional regulator [Microlunatus soli]|uniref:DNA-binding transcriptional regulator, MerR family n=1 Tax=Microlunatus soli TaxID=630515 RepID=A0A1H1Z636_9ACTN|nr:MerR family transcriptional regulator [Microlunatus soli]SDT29221.1 DNA-binding transcriptional regulator, MerR family [Microlunatus soli]
MPTLNSARMRTAHLARRADYSVQQVRNLERDGVLPPAERSDNGYRIYHERHLQCALAYRGLAAGIGPVQAKRLLRAVHNGPAAAVLAMLDAAHARLDTERGDLALARHAAAQIGSEPIGDVRPADDLTIAELADALGMRTSALRHWEAAGLLTAERDPRGRRRFTPEQVRDARIVQQLRSAGYPIDAARATLEQLRTLHGSAAGLEAILADREESITRRSRSLLAGSAALSQILPLD